jgi:hypothetical protein
LKSPDSFAPKSRALPGYAQALFTCLEKAFLGLFMQVCELVSGSYDFLDLFFLTKSPLLW